MGASRSGGTVRRAAARRAWLLTVGVLLALTACAPATVVLDPAAGLAEQLRAVARDARVLADADEVDRLTDAVDAARDDAASVVDALGPDGVLAAVDAVAAVLRVAGADDVAGLTRLADALRSTVQAASVTPGFDGETFGADLVRYATGTADEQRQRAFERLDRSEGAYAAVLTHLLAEGEYGEDLVRGVAWALDEVERADPVGAASWVRHGTTGAPLGGPGADPVAEAMGQLAQHPALALEFFVADSARSGYYLAERDWSRDGFAGIAAVALAVGTDPDNLAAEPERTGLLVSTVADQLWKNPAFTPERAAEASETVADLLKHYVVAVDVATPFGAPGPDYPARTWDLSLSSIGPFTAYPVMDGPDVEGLLAVALSTDEGVARIAEGVAGYRQAELASFAARYPEPDAARVHAIELENILYASTGLDAVVRGELRATGPEADRRVAAYVDLVSRAEADLPVPFVYRTTDAHEDPGTDGGPAWVDVRQLPADVVERAFARASSRPPSEQDGRDRVWVTAYRALLEAGVLALPDDLAGAWAPGGELVTLGDIPADALGERAVEAREPIGFLLSDLDVERWAAELAGD